jgi:iron complex outermembrane recepter protein
LPATGYAMDRHQSRFVLGANGKVTVFGTSWKASAYVEDSLSRQDTSNTNTINVPNYFQAIDAVRAPNGSIVCRSTLTNPTNGCIPYDLFGTGVNSQAAINYVEGSPYNDDDFRQTVESINVSGEPFSDWAGPISVATGFEHREEAGSGNSDPYEEAPVPWFFSAGLPTIGHFTVTEGYVETVVPLAKDAAWAKSLDFNGAVRGTGYDSGPVATWKVGVTYSPVDDVRFRVTRSHDIREPNLNDLFMGTFATLAGINDPFNNNVSTVVRTITSGNPKLVPEDAETLGLGVVFQPSFLPGFNASIDYYSIDISNGIGTLTSQQIIDLCYAGNQQACGLVQRSPAGGSNAYTINAAPLNLSSEKASGLDIETSYQFPLNNLVSSWPGKIGLRALGTHYINDTVNSGIPGSIPVQNVGNNSDTGPPHWRYDATIDYSTILVTLAFTLRGVSAGVYSNSNIQCTSGCPASTPNYPTLNDNHIAGATYLDVGATYRLGGSDQAEVFFNIRNLMNRDPAAFSPFSSVGYVFEAANPALYDVLGRVFRAGVRFKL